MKFLGQGFDMGAESGEEAGDSPAAMSARLVAVRERLKEMDPALDLAAWGGLRIEECQLLVNLEQGAEAWTLGREAFDLFTNQELWERAVETCDVLFQAEQPGSLAALGHGVWLAVTFPIDPEITIATLQHVVEETPDDSDGAAVAAATAVYVVGLRCEGKTYNDLHFFATQMLGTVARRHSDVVDQEAFDGWVARLELDQPDRFLVRLRNIVDVLVQDDWWIDREAIHTRLPDN